MTAILVAIVLISGSLLMLVAAIGIVRLPDVLCRSHALTKAMTLGISLLLIGLMIHHGTEAAALKVILAIVFQIITVPVAGHLISLVALRQNLTRWKEKPVADHRPKSKQEA